MKIAVLTMTRDRLDFTKHCFGTLKEFAGCSFDHYVLDQGSTDGTADWLCDEYDPVGEILLHENIGICRGANLLLDECFPEDYDVIVRYDNDCELFQPGTLQTACCVALYEDMIIAPRVLGLRNPPRTISEIAIECSCDSAPAACNCRVDEVEILGGIFMAIPARLFSDEGFRYDVRQPPWSGDELICPWYRARGGRCGYLTSHAVNHYLTTDGQAASIPAYFDRRVREGGPAL